MKNSMNFLKSRMQTHFNFTTLVSLQFFSSVLPSVEGSADRASMQRRMSHFIYGETLTTSSRLHSGGEKGVRKKNVQLNANCAIRERSQNTHH